MILNDQISFWMQALGDMVESIAGAILIDTKLNLDEVWRIFKPMLSPLVTPDKLELPPLRELNELCDSLGYFIKEKCIKKGDKVQAELSLQLQDVLLVREGQGPNRKTAKGDAAFILLKDLEVCFFSNAFLLKFSLLFSSDVTFFQKAGVYLLDLCFFYTIRSLKSSLIDNLLLSYDT